MNRTLANTKDLAEKGLRVQAKAWHEGVSFILFIGAVTALTPLSIDLYLPAFQAIGRSLSADVAHVELSLSSYFIGLAFGQLFWGPIADKYGRRRPLLAGLALYVAASVGCATAPTIGALIVWRVGQALGGCAAMVISRAIVRDLFNGTKAAQVFSLLMLVSGLAPLLAPMVGGYLVEAVGWRPLFLILASVSGCALLMVLGLLPETCPVERRQATLRRAVASYGELLHDKQFMGYALTCAMMSAGMFAYIAGSSFVFMELYGMSKVNYARIFAANAAGLTAMAQLNRFFVRRFSIVQILSVVSCLSAGFAVCLFAASTAKTGLWTIIVPLFGYMSLLGLVFPNAAAAALAHQAHRAATASALTGSVQWVIACTSSLLVSYNHDGTARPMSATLLGAGLLAPVLFFALCRPRLVKQPVA